MKKILSTLCMALTAVAMIAQDPVITFDRLSHDFGKISVEDGRVTTVFTFKNEGMSPLVLSNVRASCGCTTPSWPREPIEPGQTGSITVTYRPSGSGHFSKSVYVTSNATEQKVTLKIEGEIIPKKAKPEDTYTEPVGALRVKSRSIDLGEIKKGQTISGELEYANLSEEEHTVDILSTAPEGYLIYQADLSPIKPGEIGKFTFAIDSRKSKLYGVFNEKVYVVIDGKKDKSEAFELHISGSIVEDFSLLSPEQLHTAPIIEVPEVVDFGVVPAGKKNIKKSVTISNSNVDPLQIYRVYSASQPTVDGNATKKINEGKKGTLNVVLNTIDEQQQPLAAGSYKRQITLYTNDPKHPVVKVTVRWVIE